MNRRFVVMFLAAWIGRAASQTPLTLDEALRLSQQNNLQIKKQQQKNKIAELDLAGKRGALFPSLDVSATASYTDEIAAFDIPFTLPGIGQPRIELGGHDRTDLAIAVRQPLFSGFRLRTQVAISQTALETEETRLAALNQQTAFQVGLLFYQMQNLKKERRIQEASLNRLAVQLEQTHNLYRAAQVMAYDTLQVFNQALQIKIQTDQNQRDQRLAELQMARLLDLPATRPIAEIELPRPSVPNFSQDSVVAAAVGNRPEIRAAQLSQRAAQLSRKLAISTYFPDIGAEAKYHYAKPGLNQVADEWMDYTTVGISLQWNLWRWGQDRQRARQAEVEYDRLALEEHDLRRSIELEVEKSLENIRFAAKQIELAERLFAQQEERYRIVVTQQREGVAATNEVVVAEADLTQAELQLQRALIQYHVSEMELKLATGSILQ